VNVLVLNAGSSSLRFQLLRTDPERMKAGADERLARGSIDRIGGEAILDFTAGDSATVRRARPIRDHRQAFDAVVEWLIAEDSGVPIRGLDEIEAVGHRVVHGGERFTRSAIIDDDVLRGIEDTIDLAPLHNPHNLRGILAARQALGPKVPQVAVFDTSFHTTIPDHAYLYAIPYSLYRRHRVRRYGFHGTSHRYVAWRFRRLTGAPREGTRLITLHLGNGCSACAIADAASVDTSMGFTPLEGLVMGTRSGDLDPAIIDFIAGKEGLSLPDVETLLNKQSGLLGVSGLTHDMRDLLAEEREHDDRRARLAIDVFCHRVRKYIGAYLAVLGGADAVVFAGGIGENSPEIRSRILAGMEWAGIELDAAANERMVGGAEGAITLGGARVAAWVIPTDEELLLARDTVRLVLGIATRF
jgi:acetate kinase